MRMNRGGALGALLLVAVGLAVSTPAAQAQDPAPGVTLRADIVLDEKGLEQVTETVTVPESGSYHQVLPLRIALPDSGERRFDVTDISATGPGTAQVAGDTFTIDAKPGESTFKYTVHGTVSDLPGSQIFHWTGTLDADVSSIAVTVIAPSYQLGIESCTIGPIGKAVPCSDVRVEPDGTLHLDQENLQRGDVLDITMQLPPGTVPANADISGNDSGPFAPTTPVWIALAALLLALAGGAGYVLWARNRDAAALNTSGASAPADPIRRDGGTAQFVSPDGVLPGEAGALLDGTVSAAALAATAVDLAARRYLRFTAISDTDWRITRLNAADDQLRAYERATYDALLPAGSDTVQVSELRKSAPAAEIRRALQAETAASGLLSPRGRRDLTFWVGAALLVVGVVATVALAIAGRHALVGVALAAGGAAALLVPRWLPPRTPAGSELAGKILSLQQGLESLAPDRIPVADREVFFSRALPFTIINGRADNWIRVFRDTDLLGDGDPGLYWFGGFERERNLHRFAGHFPYFITALQGVFGKD
ncbi:DUF2207 family protein [Nocardia stercoris]|uniref:DUF2207 domain-containing protein n=1 Tax=Nocardia stercoris TaxID=2483361 RepID=A0A3M2L9R3_9NOCA|nr:DUF2207 domain-containing protein [Nocardia stercoris]RMI34307.1 DUF2207 domain-containing protein [Nocardia stercoris]